MAGLDRRITLERNEGERNDQGEFVDAWNTLAAVWAQRRGLGAVDVLTEAGEQTVSNAQFTIRYRSDVLLADVGVLRILDAEGRYWNIESVAESDARRRFILISAVQTQDLVL